jgi:hypothetical protein
MGAMFERVFIVRGIMSTLSGEVWAVCNSSRTLVIVASPGSSVISISIPSDLTVFSLLPHPTIPGDAFMATISDGIVHFQRSNHIFQILFNCPTTKYTPTPMHFDERGNLIFICEDGALPEGVWQLATPTFEPTTARLLLSEEECDDNFPVAAALLPNGILVAVCGDSLNTMVMKPSAGFQCLPGFQWHDKALYEA